MAHLPRIFVLREEAHVMRLRGLFDSRGSFGVVRSPMHLFERGRQSNSRGISFHSHRVATSHHVCCCYNCSPLLHSQSIRTVARSYVTCRNLIFGTYCRNFHRNDRTRFDSFYQLLPVNLQLAQVNYEVCSQERYRQHVPSSWRPRRYRFGQVRPHQESHLSD